MKKWFSEDALKGIAIKEFKDGVYEFSQTTVPYGHEKAEPIRFKVENDKVVEATYGLTDVDSHQKLTLLSKNAKQVVTFSRVDTSGKAL